MPKKVPSKSLVVTSLFRDNAAYIPYYLKCCESLLNRLADYDFEFLFYTNNNTDNTTELLRSQGVLPSVRIVEDEYDEDHLTLHRTLRLAVYRERMLDMIRQSRASYVLMIDSDIMFNGNMVAEMIKTLETADASFVAPFSINKMGFYYDTYAHVEMDDEYMWLTERRPSMLWKRHVAIAGGKEPRQVKSAFSGFFLGRRDVLDHPTITYISGRSECEHLAFNQAINDMGRRIFLDPAVTPIQSDANAFQSHYRLVSSGRTNFRKNAMRLQTIKGVTLREIWVEARLLWGQSVKP